MSLSSRIASAVAVVLVMVAAREGHAATMTFSSLSGSTSVYSEDGITATGSGFIGLLADFSDTDSLHLDDGGTDFARTVTFTMASRFSPVAFDVFALSYHYCPAGSAPPCATPYQNVRVRAFRDGVNVFDDLFSAGSPGTHSTYSLAALEPIDSLSVSAVLPDIALGGMCTDAPCGHFNIDTVVLSPVPEPTVLAQLSVVVLGLWGVKRRSFARSRSR